MFRELEFSGRVGFPINSLDGNGSVAHSSVVTCLLKELLLLKSTKEHGYFLAITKLKSIGNVEYEEESSDIFYPVAFFCRTFLPVKGDVMLGVVHKLYNRGVFLRCGPMQFVYLSATKMPNFHYVRQKTQEVFMNDDLTRIETGVVIRFLVFAVSWRKKHWDAEREFFVLASLEGDCLGPVSLPGSDELDS